MFWGLSFTSQRPAIYAVYLASNFAMFVFFFFLRSEAKNCLRQEVLKMLIKFLFIIVINDFFTFSSLAGNEKYKKTI